jgi:hypothetical protein
MIYRNYNLLIAEPWDFESPDGKNIIKGGIMDLVSKKCIIYKMNCSLTFGETRNDILVLFPRHQNIDFSDLDDKRLAVNCAILSNEIALTSDENTLAHNSKFVLIASFEKAT